MIDFYPGQRVICINATPTEFDHARGLITGNIYTIRSFSKVCHQIGIPGTVHPLPSVTLEELNLTEHNGIKVDRIGYLAERFRPDDCEFIEKFRKMCNRNPVDSIQNLFNINRKDAEWLQKNIGYRI